MAHKEMIPEHKNATAASSHGSRNMLASDNPATAATPDMVSARTWKYAALKFWSDWWCLKWRIHTHVPWRSNPRVAVAIARA